MQYATVISIESPAVTVHAPTLGAPHPAARRRRRARRPRALRVQRRQRRRRRTDAGHCRTTARPRTTTARRRRRRTCSSSRSISGTTSKRTTAAARATAIRAANPRCSRAATTSTWRMPPPTASSLCRRRRLDDGHEGRRRPQLLAREQRRVRRHLDDVDHELGRLDGLDGGAQDRARAAGAARPRPEQELPGRPGLAVLDDRVPGARAALLRVPCVGHGAEAAAVLRRGPAERRRRHRARVRGREVEDESRRSGDLALRAAPAQRVPQLLDAELRQRRECDAGGDPAVQQRRDADGRRSEP